jgi:RNA-directed DNA polymerase
MKAGNAAGAKGLGQEAASAGSTGNRRKQVEAAKPFNIPKQLVYEAFKAVKANAGAAGVDKESIDDFEQSLKDNLYKLWNRMSSGTYFPPPVKAVAIPKKNGGERILGVPTVVDRVAQTVVRMVFEPNVESIFLPDSYGYRPGKSALDAVGVTRERCWYQDWVLEFDVRRLFDNIDHELLLKAVRKHTECKWVRLYIERWLKAPMQLGDGTLVERTKGTPQGGVVSPVLSNLFLHYAFDLWMGRTFPGVLWCRYADDGLVHCKTEQQAQAIKAALTARFAECGLELHPDKTRIVYCKDGSRKGEYPNTKFDFLGYTFQPRSAKNRKDNRMIVTFTPAVSQSALKDMRQQTRRFNYRNRVDLSLEDISRLHNPVLRGWLEYYGRYCPSALYPMFRHFNRTLVGWARRKYKRLQRHKTRASLFIERISKRHPRLFVHWQRGIALGFS